MCKARDLVSDIEAIAMSGRRNVDVLSILFSFVLEDSTINLPLAFVISITILLNCMVIQWVLGYGCSNRIIPGSFHVVLELISAKVHSLILGMLEGDIDINRVHGQSDW
jgi:hypothetical protein